MTFRIFINHKPVHTGPFPTWWDALESALNRAALRGAINVQVKRV